MSCGLMWVIKKEGFGCFSIPYSITGRNLSWVWGKRNYKTVLKLRVKLKNLAITFGTIYTDDFLSFSKKHLSLTII